MRERSIRIVAGALALLLLASVVWGLGRAAATPVNLGMLGFEIVLLVAASVGVLFGLGRFPQAPGLTLLILSGTVVIGAGLGLVSLGLNPVTVARDPLFLARFLLALAFGALAIPAALNGHRRAWRTLVVGGALACGSAGAIGVGVATSSRWLAASGPLQVILIVVSLLLVTALLGAICVGLHLVIRAFEMASLSASESPA